MISKRIIEYLAVKFSLTWSNYWCHHNKDFVILLIWVWSHTTCSKTFFVPNDSNIKCKCICFDESDLIYDKSIIVIFSLNYNQLNIEQNQNRISNFSKGWRDTYTITVIDIKNRSKLSLKKEIVTNTWPAHNHNKSICT